MNKDIALRDVLKNLREENLAIFVGAGMSLESGYVNWSNLLHPLAVELDLNIEKENDLVLLAQYHYNEFSSRSKINQILVERFSHNAKSSENHKILSRLPISTFWTTNYDKLIEKSLEMAGKNPDVKYTANQLANTKPKRDAIVYKMHGDVEHPDNAILTKDDYESYHQTMKPFLTALAGDLVSKTFLFIGFSFTDPNLDYILSRVRLAYGKNQRRHYCFIKKIKLEKDEEQADYHYRIKKQKLFIQDLKRFGIVSILIEEYSEITEFLYELERCYKRDCVFISGAAYEYGKWGKEDSERFIHKLSKRIINEGFRIVSGFGLGVGSAVISGALEEIYSDLRTYSKDNLILKPFPQNIINSSERVKIWSKYRNDMISYAGIAIFIYGNKIENGKIIESNGMREEFEIAKNQGLILLPIGTTGYISKRFHDEISLNFDEFYPNICEDLKIVFVSLNDDNKTPDEIIEIIIELLKKMALNGITN